jgi:hypothetical protein
MTKLPSINDEIRQASRRIDVSLKPREELPDEAIEARSRAIGEKWGSSTQLAPGERRKEPPKPTAPLVSVRFDAPDYLDKELSVRAAEEGVTKTYLILQALGRGGYRLDEADLVKDRRRLRR